MSKDVMSTTSSGSLLTLSNCTQVSSDHIPFDNRKTISQLLTSYEVSCILYSFIKFLNQLHMQPFHLNFLFICRKQGVVYMQQYVHLKLRLLGGILAVQDVPRK